jgi:hypothetical protein
MKRIGRRRITLLDFPRILLIGGSVLLIGWLAYYLFSTIFNPYPIEYREGAAQVLTGLILKGSNPFAWQNQPSGMNNYGIAYNLVALPLAALFGNTLAIHRFVSVLFIILTGGLITKTIAGYNPHFDFALAGGCMAVLGLAAYNNPGAFPSTMGVFLFLAAVLIPSNRSFDIPSLVFSGLASLVAFYTKPYFLLSFGIVFSFVFLFVSKKKGLYFGSYFILLAVLSGFLINRFFPFYFYNTVLNNAQGSDYHFEYLISQLKILAYQFSPCLILSLLIVLNKLLPWKQAVVLHGTWRNYFDLLKMDNPFILKPVNYPFYILGCSLLANILVLGGHLGTHMTYFYQLVMPPFFLWLFQYLKFPGRLASGSVPIILFNMLLFCSLTLNPKNLNLHSSSWEQLYQYLQPSYKVLNSPVLVSRMLELGMEPVDSGQTEYFMEVKPYETSIMVPSYAAVKSQANQFQGSIINAVKNKTYDRVILTRGHSPLVSFKLVKQYYHLTKTIRVVMPQASHSQWYIEVWEPNP